MDRKIIKYCQQLSLKHPGIVFVGGIAMMFHGIDHVPSDIDIVAKKFINNSNVIHYKTDSAFSKSGQRAFFFDDFKVDIFIESELPEFQIIEGLRIQTINSMINYYESIYPHVKPYWQKQIIEKTAKLKLHRWQVRI